MLRTKSILSFAMVFIAPSVGSASYGIYVGKNLTIDGSVFLAGYGDEPSSHWLEIVPRRKHAADAVISVGATHEARMPGRLMQIPQAPVTFKYITMNYSSFAGFPAPLTNGGLNEHHVAGRDIWSPSRKELREMTPKPQTGPNYSDLSRIAMERAKTAREAVEIVGALIDKYGYTTYGGNSHLFADVNEGWIFINFAGGQKLWVAQRLGPDDIRVSRPGYIGEVPLDFQKNPDFMGSANLISFAVKQGWFDDQAGQPFNVNKVYGDGMMRHEAVAMMEKRLGTLKGKIGLKDVMAAVRPVEITRDTAGYGQVAHLRKGVHAELGILWVAAASPLTAPFTPFHLGITDVPPEFKRHRYLTVGEADRFQDPDHQGLESTRFAVRTFKRLFYLTKEHEKKFLPEVTEALEAFESKLIAQQPDVEKIAAKLFAGSEPELARRYLTYYSGVEALGGMRLADDLAIGIEARTRTIFGIRPPKN